MIRNKNKMLITGVSCLLGSNLAYIDLAAWGIAPDKFFSAVAAVTGLSPDFKIDLVEPDTCREAIKSSILKHGVEI